MLPAIHAGLSLPACWWRRKECDLTAIGQAEQGVLDALPGRTDQEPTRAGRSTDVKLGRIPCLVYVN